MARVVGFEPTIMVLETIALDQTKLHRHKNWSLSLVLTQYKEPIGRFGESRTHNLVFMRHPNEPNVLQSVF